MVARKDLVNGIGRSEGVEAARGALDLPAIEEVFEGTLDLEGG